MKRRLSDSISTYFSTEDNREVVIIQASTTTHFVPLPCGADRQWSDAEVLDYTYRYLTSNHGQGYRYQKRFLTQYH